MYRQEGDSWLSRAGEDWAPKKNGCFWVVMLEKTLESPLDCKVIKPVNRKGNPPWIFIGRTVAEAEAPILWPPDVKSQLTGKDPDAGEDWGQEKGMTEDEMVRQPHWFSGHESEQTLGDSAGQRNLVRYRPQGCKESWLSDWTTRAGVGIGRVMRLCFF